MLAKSEGDSCGKIALKYQEGIVEAAAGRPRAGIRLLAVEGVPNAEVDLHLVEKALARVQLGSLEILRTAG